ncbi:MAG: hypothetical protein R2822_03015 [Spirosomataceae bacterium]
MVQVTRSGDLLVLAYPKEGKVNTEVIKKNEVVREQETFEIKTAGSRGAHCGYREKCTCCLV